MRKLQQHIANLVARFRRDDRAVAAVELALVMPFLITLYFGSMEAAALFTADRRINTISSTMGDLVAQWDDDDGAIPVSTMNDYFGAAQTLIYPMSTTGLKQVVTCVQVLADGTTKVVWSKGYNGGTPRVVNQPYPLVQTSQMDIVARGKYIIAAETYYSYRPLMAQVFNQTYSLYHENLYMPRFGALISVS